MSDLENPRRHWVWIIDREEPRSICVCMCWFIEVAATLSFDRILRRMATRTEFCQSQVQFLRAHSFAIKRKEQNVPVKL